MFVWPSSRCCWWRSPIGTVRRHSGLRNDVHLGHQSIRAVDRVDRRLGLAVTAVIVLANVAEIAAVYLLKFLGQGSWPRTSHSK